MLRYLSSICVLLYLISPRALPQFAPAIECTVIKVHATVSILEMERFPQLYYGINYDPSSNRLIIGDKKFFHLIPEYYFLSFPTQEKFVIKHQTGALELELSGEPMSRNGTLKESGKLIGDLTCH